MYVIKIRCTYIHLYCYLLKITYFSKFQNIWESNEFLTYKTYAYIYSRPMCMHVFICVSVRMNCATFYRKPPHPFINLPCYISQYPTWFTHPILTCNWFESNLCSITFTSVLTDQWAVGVAPTCDHIGHYTMWTLHSGAGDHQDKLQHGVKVYLLNAKLVLHFLPVLSK